MAERTRIQWADSTWDPWRGCTKVSPGCKNCYAEALAKRNPEVFGGWGKGAQRVVSKSWTEPVAWNRKSAQARQEWRNRWNGTLRETFKPETLPPIPSRPKVFPSKCDWLDEEVGASLRGKFLELIRSTPDLLWLLLTKRPENFRPMLEACLPCASQIVDAGPSMYEWLREWIGGKAPGNVWCGTSVEDQERMNERVGKLLAIPSRLHFLSIEPLLDEVEIPWRSMCDECSSCGRPMPVGINGCFDPRTGDDDCDGDRLVVPKIGWVIVGGESGANARDCDVKWIESVVGQCSAAKVPAFVKQLGSRPYRSWDNPPGDTIPEIAATKGEAWTLEDKKGGDPSEWPRCHGLNVRQTPEDVA